MIPAQNDNDWVQRKEGGYSTTEPRLSGSEVGPRYIDLAPFVPVCDEVLFVSRSLTVAALLKRIGWMQKQESEFSRIKSVVSSARWKKK